MASISVTNDSEIQVKQDEVKISSESVPSEILDDIILGEVELSPGLEQANLSIHENGLLFRLDDFRKGRRSKSFSVKHENVKAESLKGEFSGTLEIIPQKCIIIKWEDFLNCRIVNTDNEQPANLLEIISYEVCAITKKFKDKKRSRSILRFSPLSSPNEECRVQLWIDKIVLAGRKYVQRHYKAVNLLSDQDLLAKKRILVLLNPVSGKGTALKTFHRQIGPFLNEADIYFELFISERPGHVRDMLRENSLDEWDAFLFVSGDGLLNEGINGLLSREDAHIVIQKPIGILPCGSGNAIASLILHYSHEFYSPLNAVFVFAKGLYGSFQKLDIGAFIQGGDRTYFCLVIAWGIGADVDVESEVIRKMGEMRFTLGFLWRVLKRRVYQADLSYLPFDDSSPVDRIVVSEGEKYPSNNSTESIQPKKDIPPENTNNIVSKPEDNANLTWKQFPGPFTYVCLTLSPLIGHDIFIAPNHDFGKGFFTLAILPYENISRRNLIQMFGGMSDNNIDSFGSVSFLKVKAFRLSPNAPVNGYLTLDGEVAQNAECSAEMSKYHMIMPTLFGKDTI